MKFKDVIDDFLKGKTIRSGNYYYNQHSQAIPVTQFGDEWEVVEEKEPFTVLKADIHSIIKNRIRSILDDCLFIYALPLPNDKMAGQMYRIDGIDWAVDRLEREVGVSIYYGRGW